MISCSVPGCAMPARTRGFCNVHDLRWHKTGDPGEPERRVWVYEVRP